MSTTSNPERRRRESRAAAFTPAAPLPTGLPSLPNPAGSLRSASGPETKAERPAVLAPREDKPTAERGAPRPARKPRRQTKPSGKLPAFAMRTYPDVEELLDQARETPLPNGKIRTYLNLVLSALSADQDELIAQIAADREARRARAQGSGTPRFVIDGASGDDSDQLNNARTLHTLQANVDAMDALIVETGAESRNELINSALRLYLGSRKD